jgi:hypothetical protein
MSAPGTHNVGFRSEASYSRSASRGFATVKPGWPESRLKPFKSLLQHEVNIGPHKLRVIMIPIGQ